MSRGHSDFKGSKTTRTFSCYTATTYAANGNSFALLHYTAENHEPYYRGDVTLYCGFICYVLQGSYSIAAQGQRYSCKAGDMVYIQNSGMPLELAKAGTQVFVFPVGVSLCSYYDIDLLALPSHTVSAGMPLHTLVKQLYRHFQMNTACTHINMDGIYRQTIGALLTRLYQPKELKYNLAAMAAELLNAGANEKKLRDELAQKSEMHPGSVSRAFKNAHGITLKRFSFQKRLHRGTQLLKSSKHSVTEISHITGFSSPSQFSNAIKKQMGCTPLEWRGRQ